MLRLLNALQFLQKQLQICHFNYKFIYMMFNRIIVFTDVIIYNKLPCAVVVGKTLCNQQRSLGKVAGEVLAEIGNQVCRRAAASGISDFFDNDSSSASAT